MPNLKEIDPREGCFCRLKVTFVKRCKEEEKVKKMGQFSETYISHELLGRCLSNLVCRVAYTEDIKYVNMIEIGSVVIEIRGVENSKLVVPVNNTFVHHTAFLAGDTQPCVLIRNDIITYNYR